LLTALLLTAAAFAVALILLPGLIPLAALLLTSLTSLLAALLAALLTALLTALVLLTLLLLVIALLHGLWLLGTVRHIDTPRMFGSGATVEPSAAVRM
jgi:hypothetical protein